MRQPVLNFCLLGLIALCTVMGANSWAKSLHDQDQSQSQDQSQTQSQAQVRAPGPYTVMAEYDATTYELVITVKEVETNSAACDLVLTGLTYSSEQQKLSLKFEPDFCQIDRMGQRKGTAKWQLPIPLRESGDIMLDINGLAMGTIQIEANTATYR